MGSEIWTIRADRVVVPRRNLAGLRAGLWALAERLEGEGRGFGQLDPAQFGDDPAVVFATAGFDVTVHDDGEFGVAAYADTPSGPQGELLALLAAHAAPGRFHWVLVNGDGFAWIDWFADGVTECHVARVVPLEAITAVTAAHQLLGGLDVDDPNAQQILDSALAVLAASRFALAEVASPSAASDKALSADSATARDDA